MPPLPKRTSKTLAAIHAKRVAARFVGRGSTFIAASEAANECGRAIWYQFRWVSPPEDLSARQLRLFETGNLEETRILDDLQQVEGVTLWLGGDDGKQFKTVIEGYIAVKPDAVAVGLPDAPRANHVVECKSANDKNFQAIKTKGVERAKPEHWLQAQLEMHGFDIDRCFYYLVNKNTDEEYVERIKPNREATSRAIARLVEIAEAPRPPGRIREDAAKPPCLFCRHRAQCHDGAEARRNCRTCLSSTPRPGGNWWCDYHECELTPEQQGIGCDKHLFIPNLVAGEQINANPEARTVTYQMRDGSEWVDGEAA